jgi:DHA1 family bicyclomycin/chloramphenicol resistance-like MFS transporter
MLSTGNPMSINKPTLRFNIALFAFIPHAQMAIDIYTPSMPTMVGTLSTSVSMIQWSMIIYLISMGLSEFVAGVASDYIGRRLTLFISGIFFLLGSVLCVFSTIEQGFTL